MAVHWWCCCRCGHGEGKPHPPAVCPSCGGGRLYFLALDPAVEIRPNRIPVISRWSLLEID
jgi:hypothetical protein